MEIKEVPLEKLSIDQLNYVGKKQNKKSQIIHHIIQV